jgi:hypothetical protein
MEDRSYKKGLGGRDEVPWRSLQHDDVKEGRAEARMSAVRQQFHFLARHHESGYDCIE